MSDKVIVSKLDANDLPFVEQEHSGDKYVLLDDIKHWLKDATPVSGEAVGALALKVSSLQNRIAELEDLLSSAYNIANRRGIDTHWERFAGRLHVHGISPVTAKTFKILPSDAEYTTPQPAPDTVPEGYALVPLKVTPAIEAIYGNEKCIYQTAQDMHDAMIAEAIKGE